MSNWSALKRFIRPFGSSSLAGRGWTTFADVGYAGVVVGAGAALLTGAAVANGRFQVALLVAGFILVGVAVILATVAVLISNSNRRQPPGPLTEPPGPLTDWAGDHDESAATNAELDKLFRSKRARPSGPDQP
jgi:hypothetical protein